MTLIVIFMSLGSLLNELLHKGFLLLDRHLINRLLIELVPRVAPLEKASMRAEHEFPTRSTLSGTVTRMDRVKV